MTLDRPTNTLASPADAPPPANPSALGPMLRRVLGRALVILGVLHLVWQLGGVVPALWARTDTTRDVVVYFHAAQRLASGAPVYQPYPAYGVEMTPFRFFYPPPFLLLVRPLAGLDFLSFAHVWLLLTLGAMWVYAACLGKLATGRWEWKATLAFGLLVNIVLRGYASLGLGQAEPLLWMLFGLALTTRARGGLLALAVLIKVHPAWALAVALRDRPRPTLRSALGFAVPALLLSLWLVGPNNWLLWWPATRPIATQGTFNPDNWSLSFALLRLMHALGFLPDHGTLPAWAKAFLSLCALAGPFATAFLARRLSSELRLSLVACAAILSSPLCWTLYFPLFLLPLAVWLGERSATRPQP